MRFPVLFVIAFLAAGSGAEVLVRGAVTDEEGGPAAGARVELHAVANRFERDAAELAGEAEDPPLDVAGAAADGTFVLSAKEPGLFRVVVRDRGRLALERTVGPVAEARDLEAASLSRTLALTVYVVDPEDRPVAGARVRVSFVGLHDEPLSLGEPRPWWPRDRHGTTDAAGRVVLPIGENEVARVAVFHPGYLAAVDERLEILTETTMRLESGVARALEVRDADTDPAADVLVRRGRTVIGRTDRAGRVEVILPAEGELQVTAETESGQFGNAVLKAPGEGDRGPATLVLEEPERLTGVVRDGDTKRPVPEAWVALGDEVIRTLKDGSFSLPLRLGVTDPLRAAAFGYLAGVSPVRGFRGEPILEHDLALRPRAALEGIVVDEEGAAVRGAEISAVRSPEARRSHSYVDAEVMLRLAARRDEPPTFTRSGPEGRFRLRVTANEVYELEVRKPTFLAARTEARAADGEELVVVLRRGRLGVGRVLDLDELPVAGARVRLWPAPRDADGRRESMSWEATTDAGGRFELRELRQGPAYLRAEAPGFAPLAVEGLNVVFEPGEGTVDLGTLLLEPGVRVAGRVVDPRGRPVAGVKVAYEPWSTEGALKPWELDTTEAVTGEDGGFAILDMVAGEKLDLTAWHIDYAATEARGIECPTEDLELTLEPTATVRGRVVGPGGRPVADGRVQGFYQALDGGPLSQSARVGPDGHFELAHLGSRGVELVARARGLGRRTLWLDLEPGEVVEGIVFELDAGAVLEGTVLGPAGEPVAGARVALRFGRFGAERTDAGGRFRLEGLEPGSTQIHVEPRKLPPASRTLELDPGVNAVEIRLGEGFEVHGRVVDMGGVPVPFAAVRLAGIPGSTGDDGAFSFENVPRGVHRFEADKRGFAPREVPDVRVEGAVFDLEVVLHYGGAVAGHVLGLEDSSLGRVQVWAVSLEDQWAEGRVDYDGRFHLGPLSPGMWSVEARDGMSGSSARGSVEVEAGATSELDLEFVRGLVLTGEVRLDGRPEPGGTVRLQGLDVVYGSFARTDYAGTFNFEGLQPGRYRAVVRGGRKELLKVREIEVLRDEHVVFELATGELRGRTVSAGDGDPVGGASVTLEPPASSDQGETIHAEADSDGRFRFARLAEGRYRLRAEKEGYAVHERLVGVEAGLVPGEAAIELERTSGVALEVRDAAGGVPAEVWAAAFAGPAAVGEPVLSGRFLPASAGTVRLASLPPGTWTLVLRSPASGTVVRTVTAPDDAAPVRLPAGTRLELGVPGLEDGELAWVEIAGAGGPFVSVSAGGVRRRWRLGGGWTAIEGLPPGDFTVTAVAKERTWKGRAVAPLVGGAVRLALE